MYTSIFRVPKSPIMYTSVYAEVNLLKLRIEEILKEKGKTKYWLYMQMGLSYQNLSRMLKNQTTGIKFENLRALCDILECTPNDLFDDYHTAKQSPEKK